MIEIYFGSRVVYLTDEEEPYYAHFVDRNQLKNLVSKFQDGNYEKLYISNSDLNLLFQNFKSLFMYEEAAGGLVINSSKQILAIKNHDTWQLPKGHVQENESYAEAALREVVEECSISEPTIIDQLPSTFHTFRIRDKWHLKRTYWFKMMYKRNEKPIPQAEEGITEAKWFDKKDLYLILENTYKNLMPIWEHA
ncbi:MAG: NUDIX domain-containing protein [Bacteroidales bacterium]|nr:NUDIX domain-containing protein [Bacteroidales bacterium]